MKQFIVAFAAIFLFAASAICSCASGAAKMVDGNWYCEKVKGIRYTNVGGAGKYRNIDAMNPDGSCSSAWKSFDGPISPLDEEVSILRLNIAHNQANADPYRRFLFTSEVLFTLRNLLFILRPILPRPSVISLPFKLVAMDIKISTMRTGSRQSSVRSATWL
jgi:hypothetical protein